MKSYYTNNNIKEFIYFVNVSENMKISRIIFIITLSDNTVVASKDELLNVANSVRLGLVRVDDKNIDSNGKLIIPTIPDNILNIFI